MKVSDIMTSDPVSCKPGNSLAEVASLLWEHNCGALPVVGPDGAVTGIITDRDICIAVGTRDKRAAEIPVHEVISGKCFTCGPEDDIHTALRRMQENRVRRLPVIGEAGLIGVISIDDIVLNARWAEAGDVDLSFLDVIRVLRRVTYPAQPCAGSGVCWTTTTA
jgi:CBS domain-containing protein